RRELRELRPHLVISDFSLPGYDGSAALSLVRREAPDVPFIFLSGTIGEERAIEALKAGAVDYVLKTNLARLGPAVKRALGEVALRSARQDAETRIERLSRVLHMLSAINAGVVRIRDRTHLFQEACRIAHDIGKYSCAFVTLIDPGTRIARPVAWSGVSADKKDEVSFPVGPVSGNDEQFDTITGRALRTGMEVVCNDILGAGSRLVFSERLFSLHINCLAAIPLLVDDTPVGAFTVGSNDSCGSSEEELRMLREVASNLSFALQYLHKEDAVRFLSYFDPLTGLAKRALFCERVARLLARHAGEDAEVLVVAFDIERLGVINDSFGRHVGDQVVQFVADSVKSQFEGTDCLAHLDSGNFAVVISGRASYEDSVRVLHERLAAAFSLPLIVGDHEIRINVKAGLARYPENGVDAESLLQNAEAALHKARKSGERFLRHRREINTEVAERLALEQRLRVALDAEQFELHYQPQFSVATRMLSGAEALLRWRDPGRGLVAPAVFLSVLESTGLIVDVGEWVLVRAVHDLRRWQRLGFESLRIAVNVSPVQLRDPDFEARFFSAAGWQSKMGNGLDIEITEGALLEDSVGLTRTLQSLRSAGAQVSIDDFGTGYSSLSRLSQLPVDALKIDRSFTRGLVGDENSQAVVSTIVSLARAFKLSTVAEGVETVEQFEILRALGCEQSQGYLHGRPVPADEFDELLGLALQTPLRV
ncbi:MAG TPA: EAL domain-containing protein, partial [Steroidobacteraceae bacterium]|nr:EAL domain-containing protein [Steroidobacteraceae bacterium]